MNSWIKLLGGCAFLIYFSTGLCPATPRFAGQESTPSEPYRQPAAKWTAALAVGNGRLGAVGFGGISRERLQLNEDTLKYREASKLIRAKVMSGPLTQMPWRFE